jgi:hypothetical protein
MRAVQFVTLAARTAGELLDERNHGLGTCEEQVTAAGGCGASRWGTTSMTMIGASRVTADSTTTKQADGWRVVTPNSAGTARRVHEYGNTLENVVKWGAVPVFGAIGAGLILTDGILGKGLLAEAMSGTIARPGGAAARLVGGGFGVAALGTALVFNHLARRPAGLGPETGMLPGGLPLPSRGETWTEFQPQALPIIDTLLRDYDHDGDGSIALQATTKPSHDERAHFFDDPERLGYNDHLRPVTTHLSLLQDMDADGNDELTRGEIVTWARGHDVDADGWIGRTEQAAMTAQLDDARHAGTYEAVLPDRS